MKKLFGLLIGTTMMASIPVMADEQVLRDSELDNVTASANATAGVAIFAQNAVTATGAGRLSFRIAETASEASASSEILVTGTGARGGAQASAVVSR